MIMKALFAARVLKQGWEIGGFGCLWHRYIMGQDAGICTTSPQHKGCESLHQL